MIHQLDALLDSRSGSYIPLKFIPRPFLAIKMDAIRQALVQRLVDYPDTGREFFREVAENRGEYDTDVIQFLWDAAQKRLAGGAPILKGPTESEWAAAEEERKRTTEAAIASVPALIEALVPVVSGDTVGCEVLAEYWIKRPDMDRWAAVTAGLSDAKRDAVLREVREQRRRNLEYLGYLDERDASRSR